MMIVIYYIHIYSYLYICSNQSSNFENLMIARDNLKIFEQFSNRFLYLKIMKFLKIFWIIPLIMTNMFRHAYEYQRIESFISRVKYNRHINRNHQSDNGLEFKNCSNCNCNCKKHGNHCSSHCTCNKKNVKTWVKVNNVLIM